MSDIGSSAVRPVYCARSELVVLVFERDAERGERTVTARDALLQAVARFFGIVLARRIIQDVSDGGGRPKAVKTQPSCDERQRLPAW
jgi:hypothetical protein